MTGRCGESYCYWLDAWDFTAGLALDTDLVATRVLLAEHLSASSSWYLCSMVRTEIRGRGSYLTPRRVITSYQTLNRLYQVSGNGNLGHLTSMFVLRPDVNEVNSLAASLPIVRTK